MDFYVSNALLLLATVAQLVLVTLGIAVIFGMMGVINFAHGEFITMGAYSVVILTGLGVNVWLALLVTPVIIGAVGLLIERVLIRFFYGRLIDSLLATFGLSLVMVQLMIIFFGSIPIGVSSDPLGPITIGAYGVPLYRLVFIILVAALVIATWWIFTHTMYGLRARAAVTAPDAALTAGINKGRTNMITFAIGAGLAGAAGALLAPTSLVFPYFGQNYLVPSFLTLLVGGAAPITGSLGAGAVLGSTQYAVTFWTSPVAGAAMVFLMAIIILRVLPNGLSANWRSQL